MRDGGGMMGNGFKLFILTVLVSLTISFFLTQSPSRLLRFVSLALQRQRCGEEGEEMGW